YSPIRPKQITDSAEQPTQALKQRGVRYIELRSVDLACTYPLGLDLPQMRFLELFLLCCLLRESPPLIGEEKQEASRNALGVACCGRTPGLHLRRRGRNIPLRDWARELAEDLRELAQILDTDVPETFYQDSLKPLFAAIADVNDTPSARILAQMREDKASFQEFTLRMSHRHAEHFRSRRLEGEKARQFRRDAENSLAEQAIAETSEDLNFDEFLRRFFTPP
ncbi:MAG: glutamate--cysteine ligase, partial [Methylococcaceae bacterium]|nr:glutamate--cysteine ligase [Methylococcaceae bacterium]